MEISHESGLSGDKIISLIDKKTKKNKKEQKWFDLIH